jgi:hypothetical protein
MRLAVSHFDFLGGWGGFLIGGNATAAVYDQFVGWKIDPLVLQTAVCSNVAVVFKRRNAG